MGWYTVRVTEPDRAAEIALAIDSEFANSAYETKAEPEEAFIQGFANQVGNIAALLTAILVAVFFTILLVTGNTMAQSVRERIQRLTDTGVIKKFTLELNHDQLGFDLEAFILIKKSNLPNLKPPQIPSGVNTVNTTASVPLL